MQTAVVAAGVAPAPGVGEDTPAFHSASYVADVLVPWRAMVAVAEATSNPFLEVVSTPLKVPGWLVEDFLCEAAAMLAATAGPWSATPTVLAVDSAEQTVAERPLHLQSAVVRTPVQRCGDAAAAAPPLPVTSPVPGRAPMHVVLAGLIGVPLSSAHGGGPRGTSSEPGGADTALRFALVEVSTVAVTLTSYHLPKQASEDLAAAFASLVRGREARRTSGGGGGARDESAAAGKEDGRGVLDEPSRCHGWPAHAQSPCVSPGYPLSVPHDEHRLQQVAWVGLRTHLLTSVIHQKLGLYRHYTRNALAGMPALRTARPQVAAAPTSTGGIGFVRVRFVERELLKAGWGC